jgi:hypothetical protein
MPQILTTRISLNWQILPRRYSRRSFVADLILISSAQTNVCADQNIIPHLGCILNGQTLPRMAVSMQRTAILHNAYFRAAKQIRRGAQVAHPRIQVLHVVQFTFLGN